ncbi:MAG: transposase [Saprospiraceae bacterium]
MRKSHAQLRSELNYDVLVKELRSDFKEIPDHRAPNVVHKLSDILMSAYAIFNLKYPSLLCFEQQSEIERSNLKELFGIDKICSDAQMRRVLDEVSPTALQSLFPKRFELLNRSGISSDYRFLKKYLLFSVDGVHYFESSKIKCKRCLERKHHKGDSSFHHSMLAAVLVHPDRREVFPLGCEAIEKQDGVSKNDCELNASKRLQDTLLEAYGEQSAVIVEDALYANEPHIEQILNNGWDFIINVKPTSHEILFKHFEARKARGQVNTLVLKEAKIEHHFYWINNVALNGQGNIRVNFLYYEEHANGKKKCFSWVTSLKLRKSNVYDIMRGGRARWKIENEGFNTLKNQGYHFEHNYGHGYNHLCNVMASIMLLAFAVDQIVQATNRLFNDIWSAAKAKNRVWERIRAIFIIRPLKSFNELFQILAQIYAVQLE